MLRFSCLAGALLVLAAPTAWTFSPRWGGAVAIAVDLAQPVEFLLPMPPAAPPPCSCGTTITTTRLTHPPKPSSPCAACPPLASWCSTTALTKSTATLMRLAGPGLALASIGGPASRPGAGRAAAGRSGLGEHSKRLDRTVLCAAPPERVAAAPELVGSWPAGL